MILGAHVIMGVYGFWLPNDPRGSWSDFVAAWELFWFGPATKVTTRRSLAYCEHDHATRLAAKKALKYPPVIFNGVQARAVARGFAKQSEVSRLAVWACAIMPDHVHLVLAKPTCSFEQMASLFKGRATRRLVEEGIHPMGRRGDSTHYSTCPGQPPRSPWARRQWTAFLYSATDIRRAIKYVEDNPTREGFRPQRWRVVQPFV